jgi:hypothetical protein
MVSIYGSDDAEVGRCVFAAVDQVAGRIRCHDAAHGRCNKPRKTREFGRSDPGGFLEPVASWGEEMAGMQQLMKFVEAPDISEV